MNGNFSSQVPSFAIFCMMQNCSSRNSALVQSCTSIDLQYFNDTFYHVELAEEYFPSGRPAGLFDMVALQDVSSVLNRVLRIPHDKKEIFSFFVQIHGSMSENGLFIGGCSNFFHKVKHKNIGRPISNRAGSYVNVLKKAGFSKIQLFYAIPSHENIMHVCQDNEISKAYYMRYIHPRPRGLYKRVIVAFLQKLRLFSVLFPSHLVVARP